MDITGHASMSVSALSICFQKNWRLIMLRRSILELSCSLLESLLELSCSLAAPSGSGHKCYGTVGVQNAQTKTKKLKEEEEGAPSARGGGGGEKERSAPGEEEEALSAGGGGRRGVTS